MLKKILSWCMVLCLTFAVSIPTNAYAQEDPITSKTIITKANLSDVLTYLNLDSNSFIETTTVTKKPINTVGELETLINEIQSTTPKSVVKSKNNTVDTYNYTEQSATPRASGTVMLYRTTTIGSYYLEYEVAGKYSNGVWTGVGSSNVSVDSDVLIPVYKIGSKSLNATWTSSKITLKSEVVVDIYAGVGDWGLIKVGSQTCTGTDYWDTSYIPK